MVMLFVCTKYTVSNDTVRYERYVSVQQYTGMRIDRYRAEHLKASRIERYGIISGGYDQNFNRYRLTQLSNDQF